MKCRAKDNGSNDTYVVTIGHVQISVDASTPDEAIQVARRTLCDSSPRLWDVIQSVDNSRFQVSILRGDAA